MKIIKSPSEDGTIDIRLEENEDKHLDILWGELETSTGYMIILK